MLNKIRKLREKKGFTLVALIVVIAVIVIAIIAILTAVFVFPARKLAQQRDYTTLQDGALTISNSVNNAMAKVTMGGAPSSIVQISVTKDDNTLTIEVDGEQLIVEGENQSAESVEKDIAKEVSNALSATLPNGSAFLASIKGGAVDGVIYRNDSAIKIVGGVVDEAEGDFNDAYNYTADSKTFAVGVSGKFKGEVTVTIGDDHVVDLE